MPARDTAIKKSELSGLLITRYDGSAQNSATPRGKREQLPVQSRIHHVNIPAPKFEQTIAFYRDVLGLKEIEPNFASGYQQRGGTRFLGPVSSEASDEPAIHISDPTPEYARAVRELGVNPRLNGHIAIAVDDIEEAKSRLTAAGIFFVDAGRWAVQDFHQIYTYDPSMNLVEINQAY